MKSAKIRVQMNYLTISESENPKPSGTQGITQSKI